MENNINNPVPDSAEAPKISSDIPKQQNVWYKHKGVIAILVLLIIAVIVIYASLSHQPKVDSTLVNHTPKQVAQNGQVSTTTNFSQNPQTSSQAAMQIPFIRNGNIWIFDFSKKTESQVTNHPDTTYRAESYYPCEKNCPNNNPNESFINYNSQYYSLPRLSPDGKTLAYTCLSSDTLKTIQERQKLLLSQPLPNPDPLQDFSPTYDLCIYDTKTAKQSEYPIAGITPIFAVEWSHTGNNLIVANENVFLFQRSDTGLQQTKEYQYTGNSNNNVATYSTGIKWSPDDTKVLFESAKARNGFNGYQEGPTLLILNLGTWTFSEIPEDSSPAYVFFGDWLDNNTVIFPLASTSISIYKEDLNTLKSEKMFNDNNFNSLSFLDLSPNKEYLSHPSGAKNTENADINLTIRDMTSGNQYQISSLFPNLNFANGDAEIIRHVWLSDNTLLFSLYQNNNPAGQLNIWQLDPMTKKVVKIISNGVLNQN